MVREVEFTNIRRVLDNILDHPMLSDVTLEQVVRYTIRFISLHGFSKFYQDSEATVDIKDFRGVLPCDLVSITQVKDCKTGLCLIAMTSSFLPKRGTKPQCLHGEHSFKTQGRVIYTSFPEGSVQIAYKSVPVDEDGFPMVIDDENYLAALEAYIKKQVFTVKFDTGKIPVQVLKNAQFEYGDLCDQLRSKFNTPSVSEMQALTNMYNTLLPRTCEFYNGFKNLGNREYLRKH